MARFSDLEDMSDGPMILESRLNNDAFLGGSEGGNYGGDSFDDDDEVPF